MNPFFIDLFLCILTYVILLLIICKRFKGFRSLNQNDKDDEGGLLFDHGKGPILDLPPGVDWPCGTIKHNKNEEEWV
jgi:hypothetical protein